MLQLYNCNSYLLYYNYPTLRWRLVHSISIVGFIYYVWVLLLLCILFRRKPRDIVMHSKMKQVQEHNSIANFYVDWLLFFAISLHSLWRRHVSFFCSFIWHTLPMYFKPFSLWMLNMHASASMHCVQISICRQKNNCSFY